MKYTPNEKVLYYLLFNSFVFSGKWFIDWTIILQVYYVSHLLFFFSFLISFFFFLFHFGITYIYKIYFIYRFIFFFIHDFYFQFSFIFFFYCMLNFSFLFPLLIFAFHLLLFLCSFSISFVLFPLSAFNSFGFDFGFDFYFLFHFYLKWTFSGRLLRTKLLWL